jgi:SAM-dependent methyltransferase
VNKSSKIENHYRTLLKEHGDSAEAAQYSSRESQFLRFAALARIGNLAGKRILDFGCGTASFAEYLKATGQTPGFYCGVDVVEEFFKHARKKVPEGHFCLPDKLGDQRFDYAFVSGVFNNRRKGNRKFWQDTVTSLFTRCDEGLAFNMMTTHVDFRDPSLFYENPCSVFEFAKSKLTPFVTICNDYLVKQNSIPFEFCVFCLKKPLLDSN